MIEGIELAFTVLQMAFIWIFDNQYTSLIVGLSLILAVFGIVLTKVRG